jgi:hypothetical protein
MAVLFVPLPVTTWYELSLIPAKPISPLSVVTYVV